MRTGSIDLAIRALLWTGVVVLFVGSSLLLASCQEKHEISSVAQTRAATASPATWTAPEILETCGGEPDEEAGCTTPEPTDQETVDGLAGTGGEAPGALPHRHGVAPGENLWGLSMQYYQSPVYWERLADWNGIEDPAHIEIGDTLDIPPVAEYPDRLYLIREGDNLTSISLAFYGSAAHWDRLAEANGLAHANRVRAGRVLRIPHEPGQPAAPDSTLLVSE